LFHSHSHFPTFHCLTLHLNISLLDSSSASHKGLYLVSSIQRSVVRLNVKACY
jgi:hypothetical protein